MALWDAESLPFQEQVLMVRWWVLVCAMLPSGYNLAEVLRVLKPGAMFVSLDTAAAEWKALQPFYQYTCELSFPCWFLLARHGRCTLSDGFRNLPPPIWRALEQAGFPETGYTYRPRFIGGALWSGENALNGDAGW